MIIYSHTIRASILKLGLADNDFTRILMVYADAREIIQITQLAGEEYTVSKT